MEKMTINELRSRWLKTFGWMPPSSTKRAFLEKNLHYHEQVKIHGGLTKPTLRKLQDLAAKMTENPAYTPTASHTAFKPGTRIIRTYQGKIHEVTITDVGFTYNNHTYTSLSAIARHITGTAWNGHVFFGIKG